MGDSDFSSQRNASLIVHHLSNGPRSDFLKNLWKYHRHQTQLLVEIAKRIEQRIKTLVQSEDFTDAVSEALTQIKKLDRTLRGGQLAAWGQAEDSQDALGKIQWHLSLYAETRGNVKERITEAIKKDNEAWDGKVKELIRDFHKQRPSMFGKLRGKTPPDQSLQMLLPKVDPLSNSANPKMDRMFISRFCLEKFSIQSPRLAPSLGELIQSMQEFIGRQLASMMPHGPPTLPPLLVLRKHTGQIVTIVGGVKDYYGVLDCYCPQLKKENDQPILYYSDQHQKHREDFVASAACIKDESMRLIPWTAGPSSGSDIYLIEGKSKLFALATVWDEVKNSEVIVQFPLRSWSVKEAIEELCEEFVASELWKRHKHDYEIECDRPRLSEYKHQLAVPGKPKKTALKWLTESVNAKLRNDLVSRRQTPQHEARASLARSESIESTATLQPPALRASGF
ncbi:hypothetical protein FB451DRAFT_1262634 [Mycena latifolia]|nr:hypothetical protein FB451DRAFT_1262634 [Mycena latifolia]